MRRTGMAVLAAGAVLLPAPAAAEVVAIPDGLGGAAGVVEIFDREPSPWRIWTPVRAGGDPSHVLNAEGDQGQDGPPSIAINPTTRLPEAVWSHWDGGDYEIAWSRFDGAAWTRVSTPAGPGFALLTDDALQDLDPRLWIDAAGNRRVAWWVRGNGVDRVVVSVLPAGETQWWIPQLVSEPGVPTRRPDIRTVPSFGSFIVAEEGGGAHLSVVVFESPGANGDGTQRETEPWFKTRLRTVGPEATLEPALSAVVTPDGPLPVVTWREGDALAVSLWDAESATWSTPSFAPYPAW